MAKAKKEDTKEVVVEKEEEILVQPKRIGCYFCDNKKEPDYKEYRDLERFLSDRAKIVGTDRTGICSKHQRRLTKAIKRARHLALLPFTPSI